jgi:hypothetical protein
MRHFLLLGPCLAAVACTMACTKGNQTPIGPHNPLADSADQIMFNARLKLTDAGVNRADVRADTAYFFDDNSRVEMSVVKTVFYNDNGTKSADLTSKFGTDNSRTGYMDARGDAYVIAVDGRTLRSPVLRYDQAKNELSSDTLFTATDSTGRRLDGIGFTSDPNMNNLHCFRNCHGIGGEVILPASDKPAAAAPAAAPPAATPAGAPPAQSGAPTPSAPAPSAPAPSAPAPSAPAPSVPAPSAPTTTTGTPAQVPATQNPDTVPKPRGKTFTLP